MRMFAGDDELEAAARAAVGACRIVGVERLRGGSKKGVYRVRLDGAGLAAVIVYRWAAQENFWPGATADDDLADPFSPANGLPLFLAAQRTLDRLGIRVPRLLAADVSRDRYSADVAVVEDIAGGTLEELFDSDPTRAKAALGELAQALDLMQRHTRPSHGKVSLLEQGGVALGESCQRLVLDRALRDLDDVAGRDARIGAAHGRLHNRLRELAALVQPRAGYGLIHGELGPDHVLVDADNHPVLIDIEGLMYFDIEWEHVFLRLRFGDRYAALRRPGLDPRRLDLYLLAMRLSLVAGPLRLLDGDFPHRDSMQRIAEHNLQEALALLR